MSATSKNLAIAKGAALAGQEKMRREHARTGRLAVEGLYDPEVVTLEVVKLDDFWDKRDTVEVKTL